MLPVPYSKALSNMSSLVISKLATPFKAIYCCTIDSIKVYSKSITGLVSFPKGFHTGIKPKGHTESL